MILRVLCLLALGVLGTGCARQGVVGERMKLEPLLQLGLRLEVVNVCAASISVESVREPESMRGDRKTKLEIELPYGKVGKVAVPSLPRQGMYGNHWIRTIRVRIWGYDQAGKRLGGATRDYQIYIQDLQNLDAPPWVVDELRGPDGQNICVAKKVAWKLEFPRYF